MEQISLRDENEGKSLIEPGVFTRYSDIHPKNKAYAVLGVASHPDSTNMFIGGGTITQQMDAYAFCFSYENTHSVAASLGNPGAVARIPDVFALADVICGFNPWLHEYGWMCYPVIYRKRARTLREANSPVELGFEKDVRFANDVEGRLLFVRQNRLNLSTLQPIPDWASATLTGMFIHEAYPRSSKAIPDSVFNV